MVALAAKKIAKRGQKGAKSNGVKNATKAGVRALGGSESGGRVDPTAVFVRGIPDGTSDNDLRSFFEARIGPTVTSYIIRGDYGLTKFKEAEDARRCLEELQGTEFDGSTLKLEAAKPKRQRPTAVRPHLISPGDEVANEDGEGSHEKAAASRRSSSSRATGKAQPEEDKPALDLRSVQLQGVPQGYKKEALRKWIEARLPGGCGIERVRQAPGKSGNDAGGAFIVDFRKERNALRALEALQGAKLEGCTVSTSCRALELSRSSEKAGRLIVRNLAFSATAKSVRKVFGKLGPLVEVHLPPKPGGADGAHKGFGFVQYKDLAAAEKAIAELNGAKVAGRGVAVDWAVDSKLYSSLQKEALKSKAGTSKTDDEPMKMGSTKGNAEAKENEGEDEREDDGEEEEEEDEDEGGDEDEKRGKAGATGGEVERMRKLLGETENSMEEDKPKSQSDKRSSKKDSAADGKVKGERKPGFDVGEGTTVFVQNVPFDATEDDLREVLKKFGRIGYIKLVADKTGQNPHRGSAFVKFRDVDGCNAVLEVEASAERRLKELSNVVRKTDKRDLPAVEGFGISMKGRRLVVKKAVAPDEVGKLLEEKKPQKGQAARERQQYKHLLNVGRIDEQHENWLKLSKSEKRQRLASMKERKFRINNPNFSLHPLRLSVRNLPREVDVNKLREAVIKHLAELSDGKSKKDRIREAQVRVQKVSLVRDSERRDTEGSRRSCGFGFIMFKDNQSALRALEHLNDNPDIFGGGRRPIVEFAIEDKRKLRMQQELFQKHAHKLAQPQDWKNKKTSGEGAEAQDDASKVRKWKHKKKEGMSRGRRQREKRRAQKADEAAQASKRADSEKNADVKAKQKQKVIEAIRKEMPKKRKLSSLPDAGVPDKKRGTGRRKAWDLADDFELRAMERFRQGGH